MGLNTTHGCYDGPYSSFNDLRRWIALQIFIDLDKMEGFDEDNKGSSWNAILHPITPLLDHSDCDGELTPDECRSIIEGAQMILHKIDPADWKEMEVLLKTFSNGCNKAIEKGETVYFK